jgi:hypothetical protein
MSERTSIIEGTEALRRNNDELSKSERSTQLPRSQGIQYFPTVIRRSFQALVNEASPLREAFVTSRKSPQKVAKESPVLVRRGLLASRKEGGIAS